jgi:hypothetical protein
MMVGLLSAAGISSPEADREVFVRAFNQCKQEQEQEQKLEQVAN